MPRDELSAWLRLALTDSVGNDAARRLLAAFGLPTAVFGQTLSNLKLVVTERQAVALQSEPEDFQTALDRALNWLEAAAPRNRTILTLGDALYPAPLLQLADPPLMLYVMGRLDLLQEHDWPACVGMVGSRNPSPQGVTNAHAFAKSLVSSGLCVVSGMALGVDAAAHEGSLALDEPQRLTTIAVVGTGLDRVYPKQHHELAHRIADQGLLVSEFPLGTPPLSKNFPKRNRLIAGLSQGTLVVEAALQSGSLITARETVELGKDVFAIPGSIHSPQSKGCHTLIKQGAKLVESAEDVLDELQWRSSPRARPALAPMPPLEGADEIISSYGDLLAHIGHDPVSLDALQARTGLSMPDLQAQLLTLELEQQISRLPGGVFNRLVMA